MLQTFAEEWERPPLRLFIDYQLFGLCFWRQKGNQILILEIVRHLRILTSL